MARWPHRRRDTAMLEARRREALDLLNGGIPQSVVASRLGVSPPAVCRWKKLASRGGEAALRAVPRSGRPPRIPRRVQRSLPRVLARGARAFGLPTDRWTLASIAVAIGQEWGVAYSRSAAWRMLRQQGFRWQRLGKGVATGAPASSPAIPSRAFGWALGRGVVTLRAPTPPRSR